jgi:nicotinate phosphoribosyltransferase
MDILNNHNALYTDLYELTMAQAYFYSGKKDKTATFDYFFRANPYEGGYAIFAGLNTLIDTLQNFKFTQNDIDFLRKNGFKEEFLNYLRDFSLSITVSGVREGEVVFPIEPILKVEGNIIECQLVETIFLNYLNFETLIATKASRIKKSAGNKLFSDFGLRRAQGIGGIQASRAAYIGGADATSNVLSGYLFNIKTNGTQAHSWIQSFDDELTAFRKYVEVFPENSILLVDTYDTLNSGVPNAIKVGHELKEKGYTLKGVRLDSGDLAYLSKKTRKMLDDAGFKETIILASNQLDEYLIRSLNEQNAPIDGYGIGTELITGKKTAALDGVYKLSEFNNEPRLKLSDTFQKISIPGNKKIYRYFDKEGLFYADGIALNDENETKIIHHPYERNVKCNLEGYTKENIYHTFIENGKIKEREKDVNQIKKYVIKRMKQLPDEHKRFEKPHIYKVGISEKLNNIRNNMVNQIKRKEG